MRKRRQRYNYLAKGSPQPFSQSSASAHNPCDAQASAAAGEQDRPPFVLRGYDSDHLIFACEETGLEHAIRCNALNKQNLIPLADMYWWEEKYPKENSDGQVVGVRWDLAANDLLRLRKGSSVYDPSSIRGIGVWSDAGRTVVHTGRHLLVDGEVVSFAHHESEFLYLKAHAVSGPHENEPTAEDLGGLIELLKKWNFADRSGSYFTLGWCITSMLSGSLDWRPNVWLTGSTEAGKSSLIDNVITPLIAPVGGVTCGEGTTAAGIRQSVKHDALPIIIDEFESDDEKARRRVDEIISMVRSSSSNQGAQVLKGTTSGQSLSYLMRSSFLFASIDVGLEKHGIKPHQRRALHDRPPKGDVRGNRRNVAQGHT